MNPKLFGLPGGGFSQAVPQKMIVDANVFNTVDFNNDGRDDILVSESNTTAVLYRSAPGGLNEARKVLANGSSTYYFGTIATYDIDNDQNIDLLFTSRAGDIAVYFGDGVDGIVGRRDYASSGTSVQLSAFDIDGDSDLDIVRTHNSLGSNQITISKNLGHYAFQSPQTGIGVLYPRDFDIADLDGNGIVDIVSVGGESSSRSVQIVLDAFTDRLPITQTIQVDGNADKLTLGDADKDGDTDIFVLKFGEIDLLINDGSGNFAKLWTAQLFASDIAIIDFNSDGKTDLAVVNGSILSWYEIGKLGLGVRNIVSSGSFNFIRTADTNGDGQLDILVGGSGLYFGLSTPSGITSLLKIAQVDSGPLVDAAFGELDGDGHRDILSLNASGIITILNQGGSSFGQPTLFSMPNAAYTCLTVYDLNKDGIDDAVVGAELGSSFYLSVLLRSNNTFNSPAYYRNALGVSQTRMYDVDGDGHTDLLYSSPYGHSVSVAYSDGFGSFGLLGGLAAFVNVVENRYLGSDRRILLGLDGYAGLDQALRYPKRNGAEELLVFVANHTRTAVESQISLGSISNKLLARGTTSAFIVDAKFQTAQGEFALGLDGQGNAIVLNSDGSVSVSPNGKAVSGTGVNDYVSLAQAVSASVWDLSVISSPSGSNAMSAFLNRTVRDIEKKIDLSVIPSDGSIGFENLTGSVNGLQGGESATFNVQVKGTSLPKTFDLLFVRESGKVVGSIPVLLNLTPYEYQVRAIDLDGETVQYRLLEGPTTARLNLNTGVLTWQPRVAGQQHFVIEVADTSGGKALHEFDVQVEAGEQNTQPNVEQHSRVDATVGTPVRFKISATDSDGDALKYFINQGPDGLMIDMNSAEVNWTPLSDQLGLHNVSVRVVDARGASVNLEFAINVSSVSLNSFPFLSSIEHQGGRVGELFRIAPIAIDADDDPLQWDLPVAPEGMVIDPATGVILWTPAQSDSFEVAVRVRDGRGGFDLRFFAILVLDINRPPLITDLGIIQAVVGHPRVVQVLAQDSEDEFLTYSLANAPAGMSMDSQSGRIEWSPTSQQVGDQTTVVSVSDRKGATSTKSFNFLVSATSSNTQPLIAFIGRLTRYATKAFSFSVEANDDDGDLLRFSLANPPLGLSITEGGTLSWSATLSQVKTWTFDVVVNDGRGGTFARSVTIDIVPPDYRINLPPFIVSNPNPSAVVGQLYSYDLVSFDPEGDPVYWGIGQVEGMTIDRSRGTIRWIPNAKQIGKHVVSAFALNESGFFAGMDQVITIDVRALNAPPSIVSVPNTQATSGIAFTYNVSAKDTDNDILAYTLLQAPAGMVIGRNTGLLRWTPNASQIGSQRVVVRATDPYGGESSQNFDVLVGESAVNLAPQVRSNPTYYAMVANPYEFQFVATDPEGLAVQYFMLSGPTGAQLDRTTGLLTWNPTSDQVGRQSVRLAARDPLGAQAIITYEIDVRSLNHVPQIKGLPRPTAIVGRGYIFDPKATDDDGDTLVYSLSQSPTGMVVDSATGIVTWRPSSPGTFPVKVTASDSLGGLAELVFSIQVTTDSNAPKLDITLSRPTIKLGDSVYVLVTADDDVGLSQISLTLNGVALALDRAGAATVTPTAAGNQTFVAKAIDVAGNSIEKTVVLSVVDKSQGPDVEITSPAFGETVTARVPIVGTVKGDVASYTILIAALGTEDFKEIGSGSREVVNGTLGTLELSGLQNDGYVLRIIAKNSLGDETLFDQQINVSGQLKLGQFTLAFTDITLPVAGIPISVTRTYDSLQADVAGDYGFGWRMEFREVNLRTTVEKTGLESELVYSPFRVKTHVFIQLPGGKREGFTFQPKLAPGARGRSLGIYESAFVADAGVTSTLSVPKTDLVVSSEGEFFDLASGLPFNPSSPAFGSAYFVTTTDGLVYEIDGTSGNLDSVTDSNGHVLTYTDSSVTSSTGQRLTFERNLQGRISAVVDPSGKRVVYAYDASGNLVTVTDRDGNATRYDYLSSPAHYLEKVVDPLGRSGMRTEYDASGRLVKVVDSAGNAVRQEYDTTNSVVKIFDQLGNPTSYEYDANGNVVTETNALGAVTKRTYDAAGNTLTETDPLGHVTTRTYDRDGNVLSEKNAAGQTTISTYKRIEFGTSIAAKLLGNAFPPFTVPATTTDAMGNTTKNTYDAYGNLLSTIDPSGMSMAITYTAGQPSSMSFGGGTLGFEYDSAGRVVKQTDANGRVTTSTYDATGNQLTSSTTLTTPTGVRILVTTMEYDANGRVVKTTDPEGGVTRSEYDKVGNRTATIDALGRRTEYRYDDRGLLVETILPDSTPLTLSDNPRTKTEYDAAGRRIATVDEAGRRTEMKYDAIDRLIETIYPDNTPTTQADNPRTKSEYDLAGQLVASIDELGHRTVFEYDSAGRQSVVRDALGNETKFEYDLASRQIAVTDALGRITRFVYDASGKRTEETAPDGTKSNLGYDRQGRLTSKTDQLNRVTRYQYDAAGKLTDVIDALSQRTEYGYDEAGNMITQKDAEGRVTKYEYDGLGRRTTTVLPMGQRSNTVYDVVGNIASTTDYNGDTIIFTYNERNWLTSNNYPDGSNVNFAYTPTGQTASYLDGRGTTTWVYDERGRLLRRTDPDGAQIAYIYDLVGNRISTTTTVPTNAPRTTTYTFDSLNRMEFVVDPEGGKTQYTYDAASRLIRTELPNNTVETRQYDSLNRLLFLENRNRSTDTVISSYRYTLDPTGNRTSITEHSGRIVDYDYDELYRLIGEDIFENGSLVVDRAMDYTYDPVGNRLTRVDSAAGNTNYNYDQNDRLLKETTAGVASDYTYDNNGNTLSKVSSTDRVFYDWDTENHLISADTDGNGMADIEYQYDADGIRTSSASGPEIIRFLIDASHRYQQVIEEYSPSGVIKVSYVRGHDLISHNRLGDTGKAFYHVDALGSTRVLTNAAGVITNSYVYDAFGRTIGQMGTMGIVYLFAGEQRDLATGLDYLRSRYMSPSQGRFVSRDSFEGRLGEPMTLHKHLYGNANPVNVIDPSGQFGLADLSVGVGVISVLAIIASGVNIQNGASVGPKLSVQNRLAEAIATTWASAMVAGVGDSNYSTWFDGKNTPVDPKIKRQVDLTWQRLLKVLVAQRISIKYDAANTKDYAYVYGGPPIEVFVTINYVNAPLSRGFNTKAGILIHDLVHELGFSEHFALSPAKTRFLAKTNPTKAAINPDSYEFQAEDLF